MKLHPWALLSLCTLLVGCSAPPTEPGEQHSIPAARLQLITEVSATIANYAGGTTNATLAWTPQLDLEFTPWRPFGLTTVIAEDGHFTVALPDPPPASAPWSTFILEACGTTLEPASLGVLFTHDGASDTAIVDPAAPTFSRRQYDGDGPLFGLAAPGLTIVFLWHVPASLELRCTEAFDNGVRGDVHLLLGAGWNPVTFYTRVSEGQTVMYVRSGEPTMLVDWREVGID